jgi:large subunit ribosomal protein L18
MVVRTSNKHTTVQFVEAKPHGDVTLASAKSDELTRRYGWRLGTGNIPASYLTGLLAGRKALTQGLDSAILDIGPRGSSKGARIFSALKGALDAGVNIPHDKQILPEDSRIRGEHISTYHRGISSESERTGYQFSSYLKGKTEPERIQTDFDKTKARIERRESP